MKNEKTAKQLLEENQELRIRIEEAEDTLQMIREGGVDAVVVQGPGGDQIFTLFGEDVVYRRLVETMNEAGLTITAEGTILFCNQRFSEILRLPMEDVVGRHIENFVQADNRQNLVNIIKMVQSQPCTERLVFKAPDGTLVPTQTSANLLRQGESVNICLVAADMTELEGKNSELRKRTDQLARLASELTLTEQRERHRLAKMLHDNLQQLLVGAKFGLEGLTHLIKDELQKEYFKEVLGLIRESINASRSLTVELSPTILHEAGLVAGLEWLVRWMEEKYGLTVVLEADENASTDREDIRIILFESVRELLFNVVKHAGFNHAKVRLSRTDDIIEIIVSDEGIGFDPDKFYQGVEAPNRFGLFSIRERLELLGGSLKIESAPQRGTKLTLSAPVKNKMLEYLVTEYLRPSPAAKPVKDAAGNQRIRVMVTDDHAVVRQGICTLLELEDDIDVVGQASDGQEAVEMALRLQPDVILMDFSMPKMNGVEATRVIHSELPDIKIVGLSMYEESDRAKAMLDVGASAYVTKSGEFETLVKTIRLTKHSDES